jgi:FixJ family two-component response regulator
VAKKLIAVIDDDESFRVALTESLSSLGYQAQGFGSGNEFLRAAGTRVYDCIVSDIHMPGMSGLDLMQRLAAQGVATPVVLITARSGTVLPPAARRAASLFVKPFDVDALVACIEAAPDATAV